MSRFPLHPGLARGVWRPGRLSLGAALVGISVSLLGGGCRREAQKQAEAQQAVKVLEEKGAACFAEGRYDCAMETYAEAAKRQPRRAALWNRFAMAARLRYYVTGEADYRDQELEALRRAAKLPGRSEHVLVNLGTVCWEMGLREEAAQAYRAALVRAPSHPDEALMRARIHRSAREEEPEGAVHSPAP